MPRIILFGGPNGAGKTTIALRFLADLGNAEFVNADSIAKGLSPFHPESVSIEAGKLMLSRLHFLLHQGKDFGFESTLTTRGFSRVISAAKDRGYTFHLVFVYLESVELAIARVQCRVAAGGHNIPVDTIARRYRAGLENLRNLYLPLSDSFVLFDNSGNSPRVMAEQIEKGSSPQIYDGHAWSRKLT